MAVTGVQLSAGRTMPQARRPLAYLPPFSTVKPKAIIVNKCRLSQRTNKKIKGYNISSLEKGQGRVSTVKHRSVQTRGDFQQQQ